MILIDQDIELTGKLKIDSGVIEVETPEGTREIAYTTKDGKWSYWFSSGDTPTILAMDGKVLFEDDDIKINATASLAGGGITVAPKKQQAQIYGSQYYNSNTSGSTANTVTGAVAGALTPGASRTYGVTATDTVNQNGFGTVHIGDKFIYFQIRKGAYSGSTSGSFVLWVSMW